MQLVICVTSRLIINAIMRYIKNGLISADDYENALLSYRQAQDAVRQQKESVQKAQTNLGYATITSPIDGVVLSKRG